MIREAWVLYCRNGARKFDWDYESRPLMAELTGHHVGEWLISEWHFPPLSFEDGDIESDA
jgi:hypothetical protein